MSFVWEPYSASFQQLCMSSTKTDENNPCFRWANRHSQCGAFSHPSSNSTSSNCLSLNNRANGCPYKFRSIGTTESSMHDHALGHVCRERRIHTPGQSDFEFFQQSGSIVQFYLSVRGHCISCLSVPSGDLAITSTTFAAVIWDADEHRSVKNCIGSRVVFYNVTTEHDSAVVFLQFLVLTSASWGDWCPSM